MRMLRPLLLASTALLLFGAALSSARAEDEDAAERRARLRKAQTEFEESEAAFVEKVNAAIERGASWLAAQQREDGHWPSWKANTLDRDYAGRAALNMLTLAKCGYELDGRDKTLQKGLTALEGYLAWFAGQAAGRPQTLVGTYSQAMLVLMYDALHGKAPKASRRPGRGGTRAKPRRRKNPCKLPKDVAEKIRSLIRWIEENQAAQVWRYPGPDGQDQDLSNTQYALLALQAAGRCGLKVSPETYRKALVYLLEQQAPRGPEVELYGANPAWSPGEERYGRVIRLGKAHARGWGYMPGNKHTGSMTSAGIACLAIIKERLRDLGELTPEERKSIDLALRDGVGWFSRNFTVERNPGNPSWHYYYLYGLERAGDLLGIRYMGEHDWYRVGAEYLIAAQEQDGSWPGAGGEANAHGQTRMIRTCFALLFLKRATVPPAVPLGPVTTGD